MKHSRSGEYKLPGSLYRIGGDLALRLAPLVPSRARHAFVRSRPHYQTFAATEISDHQGLSIRKWEALHMPSDLRGKSVIDIGCSEGFFCLQCTKRGAGPVLGIDSSLGRLLCASFIALNEGQSIHYRIGVFPDLKVPGTFDYVLCLSLLHHSLAQKDLWKILVTEELATERAILRTQLTSLRSLTAANGQCILEVPYEYDDPVAERQAVDFDVLNSELTRAGFTRSRCLGAWDHNPSHRVFKDRIIYVAEA